MFDHELSAIAVKNVDEKVYRRVKALASLKGRTVGEEINDAPALWLSLRTKIDTLYKWDDLEEQAAANNRAFEKLRPALMADHPGEFAVISSGKLAGVFKEKEEAYREASRSGGSQSIVARLTEGRRVVELGWSLLEDTAR
jgi:hypothetical protein